jgi:hypothetical protein
MSDTPEQPAVPTISPQHQSVLLHLEEVEKLLLARDPAIKGHLAEIHKNLIQFEELTHLLTDEEIGVLMAGQQIQTDTTLLTEAKKASKSRTSAAAGRLTISDL